MDFAKLIDSGKYRINNMHCTPYCENTRYVFVEKHPEKHKYTEIGNGFSMLNLYVNVELTQIVQSVEISISIDREGNLTNDTCC